MKNSTLFYFTALFALVSCSTDETLEQELVPAGNSLTAAIADGLHGNWNKGDRITLLYDGQAVSVETVAAGGISELSGSVEGTFTDSNPLYGVYPADNAVSSTYESVTVSIPATQTAEGDGYDAKAAVSVARTVSESLTFHTIGGVENQNGGSVFRLGDDGRSLFVPLYHGRTSQGIAIDAFQFDLRHA